MEQADVKDTIHWIIRLDRESIFI